MFSLPSPQIQQFGQRPWQQITLRRITSKPLFSYGTDGTIINMRLTVTALCTALYMHTHICIFSRPIKQNNCVRSVGAVRRDFMLQLTANVLQNDSCLCKLDENADKRAGEECCCCCCHSCRCFWAAAVIDWNSPAFYHMIPCNIILVPGLFLPLCLFWIFSQKHLVDRDAHRMPLFRGPTLFSWTLTQNGIVSPGHLTPNLAAKAVS